MHKSFCAIQKGAFLSPPRVVLPLVRPALLAGMTVLFIRAMTAISATIFLVSLNWSLVTVRILEGSRVHRWE